MKSIIKCIALCLIFAQYLANADTNFLANSNRFNVNGFLGYSVHLGNFVNSPVQSTNGGLIYGLDIGYNLTDILGLHISSGFMNIYETSIDNSNVKLTSIPIILSGEISSDNFLFSAGVGINLCYSEINSNGLTSRSDYLDIIYIISFGYEIKTISNLYLIPVCRLIYMSDVRVVSLIPEIQFGIRI